jgi:PAS domain S-box-containing protein
VAEIPDFELYETLPDGILVVDQKGVIRYANHETGRMFVQEPAALVSTLVEALLPEHLRERHIAHRNKYNSDPRTRLMGEGFDLVGRRANGAIFPVDIMLKPLTHLAEPMVLAVVRDMTDRRTAEAALRKSEAQLAAIVASSDDAIVGKTLDGIVTSWNEAAERIFGYSADEMIGQSIRRLIPTDRQAEEDMILDRVARGEPVKSYETVRNTKDGRAIDMSITVSPVRDATGQIIGASKIARDVTERKAHEERRLLMREANHRIKNILGVVTAIARNTSACEPGEFVSRFTARIEALAANQDLLLHDKQGVEVEDLTRIQLAHFTDLIGPRIIVHGPKLRLNAAATQCIGMSLHELATNAGKYGALATEGGRVDVGWGAVDGTFTMSWIERQGPPVSAPRHRGFGTKIMKEMVEHCVHGAVDLRYPPSGLTWRLTCPAANALEQGDTQR